jgi:CheY-like chemotaxis protein
MMVDGNILIIDDEPDLLEVMRGRLESEGYEVITSSDGSNGIEKAKSHLPDLIIIDVMMPGIDGFEVLEKIKEYDETKRIPVLIFSSGSEEEVLAKKALSLGAAGYIVKPFKTDALLFTVNKFIRK